MALPVWRIDGRILHRMSTMDHLTIAYIDSDMRYRLPCVVSSSKENQISRLCLRLGYWCTNVVQSLCSQSSCISYTRVCQAVTYKSRTIKSTWRISTPHIRCSQISRCFVQQTLCRFTGVFIAAKACPFSSFQIKDRV